MAVTTKKEEEKKAGTCTRDRLALQQLALNVHDKHPDLTYIECASSNGNLQ